MGNYIKPTPLFSGGTVTGNTEFSGELSGGTFYSGSTPLEVIIESLASSTPGGSDGQIQFNDNGVFGGSHGLNFNKTTYNLVLGQYNLITGSSSNVTIIGGENNSITNLTPSIDINFSGIFAGRNNVIDKSRGAVINGGVRNCISTLSVWSSIIGGSDNTIFNSMNSAIIGGSGMSLSGQNNTVLVPNLTASTVNASSIQSGGTDLNVYFHNLSTTDNGLQNQINTKASASSVMTLQTTVTSFQVEVNNFSGELSNKANLSGSNISAISLSADTFYSGSTPLSTIIDNVSTQFSGITSNFLPLSGGNLSGTTNFVNGAIIQSGGTDLYAIFSGNSGGGGTPGGSDTQIQFNDGGTFGGSSNLRFDKTTNSTIIGGVCNYVINNSCHSSIVVGEYNTLGNNSNDSLILGGNLNQLNDYSVHSLILGGVFNKINGSSQSLVSGQLNKLYNSNASAIIVGGNNLLTDNSGSSLIIGGGSNTMCSSNNSSIIGGTNNSMTGNSNDSAIIGGAYKTVAHSTYVSSIGGKINIISYSNLSSLIGGYCNTILDSTSSNIIGGSKNILESSSSYSSLIGGYCNTILQSSNYSSIIGGSSNTICSSCRSAIIGGTNLSINNKNDMVLVPNLTIANIPTSDPHFVGQLWNNGGIINISAG